MSRVLMIGELGSGAGSGILRLLAAASEVWTAARRNVQPIERVSFNAADRDNDARRVDAAAGCEFVDDRLRFRG